MAKARSQHQPHASGDSGTGTAQDPENVGLLSAEADTEADDDYHPSDSQEAAAAAPEAAPTTSSLSSNGRPSSVKPQPPMLARPSSLSRATSASSTPRTPNRVRFDPIPTILHGLTPNGTATSFETDSRRSIGRMDGDGDGDGDGDRDSLDDLDFRIDDHDVHGGQHRRPLLTGITAPGVALANSPWAGEFDNVHSWAEAERARPKSGLRSAFMNMANSIIGAGIIGQPYAFKQAGLLSGIILLIGLTIVVDWTICLIVVNSKLAGADSFQGTVEKCFGKSGLIAISLAQWVFAFGGMVAFGVIVGDTIPHVLQAVIPGLRDMPIIGLMADRRVVIVVFILAVSFPLTLYRDIAKLAKASTLALISMVVIIVTVVVQGFLTPAEDRGEFTTPLLTINTGIFQAIGVISFAFVCHHNSLLIYGSLETPTIDRFSKVTHFSTGISMLACMLMALSGFLTFGDKTLGNVLNNFPGDNTMVNIARLCFGLNMLTTLPLEAFVCREVMLNYYFPGEPFNMHLHLIFSTSLIISAMVLSVSTCDLGSVFELVGATSACAMAYILPPLCYIKLTTRSWKTYMAMAVVAFGCCVMAISTIQAATKMFSGEGGVTQCM
ncbi:unnamed protein product [Discula destructiva]